MPLHDVGYRGWHGPLSSQATRWTVIAQTGIRLAWKSNWLRRILFLAWLPTIGVAVMFFAFEQVVQANANPSLRGAQRVAVRNVNEFMRLWDMSLSSTTRHDVWSVLLLIFFRYPQGVMMVLVVGLIAPTLIALDMRSRAFLLYFSRPITPWEYILGKASVIWFFLAMISTMPALVLYFLGVLLSPHLTVVSDTWDLPLRILVASFALMLPTSALALLFSSLFEESRYAGFAWFATWVIGFVSYLVLESTGGASRWSLVSLYHTLGQVQSWIFGNSPDQNLVSSSAVLLAMVTLLSVMVVLQRVSAPMRI